MPAPGSLIARDAAYCIACGKKRNILKALPLCMPCAQQLARSSVSAARLCPRCLRRMHPKKGCLFCQTDTEQLLEKTYAPFLYRGVPRLLALALKFHFEQRAAALLAPAMLRCLKGRTFDVIVPVPLHRARETERGFNQAHILAVSIARQTRIPLVNSLLRTRKTKRQTALKSERQRQTNVQNAFSLAPGENVSGARVLLVDDVRTTGATALQCASVLKNAGAQSVSLLVACVAPGAGFRFKRKVAIQ